MTEIGTKQGTGSRIGYIRHRPHNCPINGCTYLISIKNVKNEHVTVNRRITSKFYDPGDVKLDKKYRNIVSMGDFVTYEINPFTNIDIQPYINNLRIKLLSISGDADLFVSFENANPTKEFNDHMSRRKEYIDQVTITELDGRTWLNRPIFISVYGNTQTYFELEFEYDFKTTHNAILTTAEQLCESKFVYKKMADEYEIEFYKFSPWWNAHENRTIVLLADVVFNDIFFYSLWEAYPKNFLTSKHDVNDTIVMYGNDTDYHFNGTYYIRLRPDFALYDLISNQEYIYHMSAFSMAPAAWGDEPS